MFTPGWWWLIVWQLILFSTPSHGSRTVDFFLAPSVFSIFTCKTINLPFCSFCWADGSGTRKFFMVWATPFHLNFIWLIFGLKRNSCFSACIMMAGIRDMHNRFHIFACSNGLWFFIKTLSFCWFWHSVAWTVWMKVFFALIFDSTYDCSHRLLWTVFVEAGSYGIYDLPFYLLFRGFDKKIVFPCLLHSRLQFPCGGLFSPIFVWLL